MQKQAQYEFCRRLVPERYPRQDRYRFVPVDEEQGTPLWKRTDLDLWMKILPNQGWCVVDAQGTVLSRP